jgi:hypothetical protein
MINVFFVCLIGGVCGMLAYGQGRGEKLAVGIIILWVIISPVSEAFSQFNPNDWLDSVEIPDYGDNSQLGGVIEDAFADGIVSAVAEKFSLDRENIRVRLYGFDQSKLCAEKINIFLLGKAAFADYKAVEKYINEMNIGVCHVEIEI